MTKLFGQPGEVNSITLGAKAEKSLDPCKCGADWGLTNAYKLRWALLHFVGFVDKYHCFDSDSFESRNSPNGKSHCCSWKTQDLGM